MIKAVIYDVDGVLADSEPLHNQSWDKALQLHGHHLNDLSEKVRSTIAGKKPIFITTDMVKDLNLNVTPEQLFKEKLEIFMDSIKTELQMMPGAAVSVKRFYNAGYKLGIGTSMTKEYITIVLNRLKIYEYFTVIVTEEEIKRGKPFPDIYLKVAEKLKEKSKECVVIEDTESGVQAAKSAGCFCIALRNPDVPPQNLSKADKIIDSHDELTNSFIKKIVNP